VIFELVFWLSILALFHTYVFYPLLVRVLAFGKKNNQIIFTKYDEWPDISIIMAVHNEEKILEKKILSVFSSGYPISKLTFYIGSDASTDNTDQIIIEYAAKYPQVIYERFNTRVGKVHIINKLADKTINEILIFTDANAIISQNAIFNLVKHFKNPAIHLVGGRMKHSQQISGNVAFIEWRYFESEYKVKDAESRLWGCMMGAFGSFYAVSKKFWRPVPEKFISDDFYITLKAIEKGGKAVFETDAVVIENVPGSLEEEFKRKLRISTGNFQNLSVLYPMLLSKRFSLSFSFFSHKVLRWFGPIFILFGIISLLLIFQQNLAYFILFIIMILCLIAPIIDYFLEKIRIHVIILRFISHFFYMNIALLKGLFKYIKGVKSNVWEPTKRD
jgi:cellulose synthase/poly-beta-1,6-N-acetylglucosamine synthase-like glycosyltransferase